MTSLGGAVLGDKTMVDSLAPFAELLRQRVDGGVPLDHAWQEAAGTALEAARATEKLVPRKGRARPLAERSVGTPDPGALSFAMCAQLVGDRLDAAGGSVGGPAGN